MTPVAAWAVKVAVGALLTSLTQPWGRDPVPCTVRMVRRCARALCGLRHTSFSFDSPSPLSPFTLVPLSQFDTLIIVSGVLFFVVGVVGLFGAVALSEKLSPMVAFLQANAALGYAPRDEDEDTISLTSHRKYLTKISISESKHRIFFTNI